MQNKSRHIFAVCDVEVEYAYNFMEYLKIILSDTYTEGYCCWNDDMRIDENKANPWGIIFRG